MRTNIFSRRFPWKRNQGYIIEKKVPTRGFPACNVRFLRNQEGFGAASRSQGYSLQVSTAFLMKREAYPAARAISKLNAYFTRHRQIALPIT